MCECESVCECECECVRERAPGDDILIFVNFRLEATVSQSPMVKGKNKRHACTRARTHTHTTAVQHYNKATHNSEHNEEHLFLVKPVLLAAGLLNFFPLAPLLLSLSLRASGGDKQVSCLSRLRVSQVN